MSEESAGIAMDAGSHGPRKEAAIRKPNTLLFLLLSGLILLLIAGLALLAAYFFLQRQPVPPTAAWVSPVAAVKTTSVAPDLAVLPLAGEPDDRVVRAALDAGELETAYATLVYSALLSDSPRSGHWLLLADRYGGAPAGAGTGTGSGPAVSDAPRLTVIYQAVLDQAALSPGLSDMTRAELSLQAARGMAALGYPTVARLALAQAENVARYSVILLPAQRRDTLERVISGYRSIGDLGTATTLQAQLVAASGGPGIKLPPAPDVLAQVRGSVALSAAVVAAIQARQTAAASLAARWLNAAATDKTQLSAALGNALVTEDEARSAFYGSISTLSEADQLAILHDRVAWLIIEYRVARGAYGTSLVSAWESRADAIGSDLAAAYTDLVNAYGRQLDSLDAASAAQGRVQLLQEALLWVRLGLFPDHAEAALSKQLVEAAQQMWTGRGGGGLVIVAQDVQGQRFYFLAGGSAR